MQNITSHYFYCWETCLNDVLLSLATPFFYSIVNDMNFCTFLQTVAFAVLFFIL